LSQLSCRLIKQLMSNIFSNFQKPSEYKVPNVTRNLIFRANIYFFQDSIKIRGARVNSIKGRLCEFESRYCHLAFGVSISISHLICISLLRCRKIVSLAGLCHAAALLFWDSWSRRWLQPWVLWTMPGHWFHTM
jgi:hypothetical protein